MLCDSSLYILPVPAGDKLFIRYMEKGVYKGFYQKVPPSLNGQIQPYTTGYLSLQYPTQTRIWHMKVN